MSENNVLIDELNIVNDKKRNVIPIEQFFNEMDLTDEQKQERIDLANKLLPVYEKLLFALSVAVSVGQSDYQFIVEQIRLEIESIVSEFVSVDSSIRQHIINNLNNVADASYRHSDDAYYDSDDRAMFISENEVNSLMNYEELQEAILSGYTHKTWETMKDRKVRHTHKSVDGMRIPIEKPFIVGGVEMMIPCDPECLDAKECVNCRCVIKYSI